MLAMARDEGATVSRTPKTVGIPRLDKATGWASIAAAKMHHLRIAVWLSYVSLALRVGANPVLDWNELLLNAFRADDSAPTLASRNLAILNTAIYDAVNSVESTHQPYRFLLQPSGEASAEAAAVGAAYAVAGLLYPEHQGQFEAAYASYTNGASAGPALSNGLELGRLIGNMAVDGRSADGSSTLVPYIPSDAPGQWMRTPPFFRPPVDPQWGFVDPFCLDDAESFMPPGPPALDSAAYASDFNLTKSIGGTASIERTAEQSAVSTFWSDFSYTVTPPGHWTSIATSIVQHEGSNLADTARLFALLSLAQADAAIVVWRAKYRYNFWRPVTAITRADEDGNAATDKDGAWQSFLSTPAFPEYVSGHSTFSRASAVVLTSFYGTDALSFSVGSDAVPGVLRNYQSVNDCVNEIAMSRLYGGIHFMSANLDGQACGAKVGQFICENFLLANAELPLLRIERVDSASETLRVHGHSGRTCIVESSYDLRSWQSICTNQVAMGGTVVTVTNLGNAAAGFFRLREE